MFFCGIDIAKRQHAVALLDEQGQLSQSVFSIPNNRAGFGHLMQSLPASDAVTIGLEATGHY